MARSDPNNGVGNFFTVGGYYVGWLFTPTDKQMHAAINALGDRGDEPQRAFPQDGLALACSSSLPRVLDKDIHVVCRSATGDVVSDDAAGRLAYPTIKHPIR
ncbi:hypothetical protein [Rhodanobacter sp. A1T4]|jgi:hypothetical protein|uniref:hypothetical protein n=1 Tax=Rhodanobacter sp. A1T4 TaxID=2723087 RepID=UPI00160DDADF|nr:hypothetical protein [Rhodanobacter sp. A1T4]MBB6247832.1 hypothetical protein [Rhodanobacter sp. A1T4]